MTSPPILRLSQALYTDVSASFSPSYRILSSRKRTLKQCKGISNCSYPLRMLLPRTFAHAERVYHAGDHVADIAQGKEPNSRRPCQDGASGQSDDVDGHPSEENGDDGEDVSSSYTNTGVQEKCGLADLEAGVHKPEGGPPATTVEIIVVVESVIGFVTLRSLLERSYRSRTIDGRVGECESNDPNEWDGTDADVSTVLGRLVGWLLLAAATARSGDLEDLAIASCLSLPSGFSEGDISSSDSKLRILSVRDRQRRRRDSVKDEDDPPLLTHDVGDAYGVTEWCDSGSEWSVFFLESQGKDARRSSKRPRGPGAVLEVKLICHPLVTMAPDLRWCLRLLRQAKALATLHNVNAKLSTLGGGYYLTRQVGQAIQLARAQSQVAKELGDVALASKCRINEAYNYIWLGQYGQAKRIILAQMAAARKANDAELETAVTIATRFLTEARKVNRRLLRGPEGDEGSERQDSSAGCGLTPQRVDVKTDEWYRVRVLPMYCTT